jgi:hypothetical protein
VRRRPRQAALRSATQSAAQVTRRPARLAAS